MMQDHFAECLVKREAPRNAALLKIAVVFGLAATAASIFLLGLIGFILFLAMCLAAMKVRDMLNVEYEYLFVERQFSVDQIFNKSKRKKAAEYALEEIQLIAPEKAASLRDYDRQVKKVSDFSSGGAAAQKYVLIVQQNGAVEKVVFEPDEAMKKCLKSAAPSRVKEF